MRIKEESQTISSRLPLSSRPIDFLPLLLVRFFIFLSSLHDETYTSLRCVFFLSFFPLSLLFFLSRGLNSLCVMFLFFYSFFLFFKIHGRRGAILFDYCDCVIGRIYGKRKMASFARDVARPTIVEETKLIVRRDAATKDGTRHACKTFEFKESRRGKKFREGGGGGGGPARCEDPHESNEVVSLTEGESSACDEDATRERRRMFVKNPCKRSEESSRNRKHEKERRLKIPRDISAKMEYYDQRELLSKRKISPRKGSSTCDENDNNNSARRERVSFARINSPSKGSLRRRISLVLARTENGDEDEREGMKIQARRRSPGEGDGREKISFVRIENEALTSSSMITEARIERLAGRDEVLRERGESNDEIKGERWSASSGSEWMDTGDARRYAKSYRCEWCEETFHRATNLSSHVNRTCPRNPDAIRRRSNAKDFNDTLYVCDTCGRRFKHRKNLTFHARNECGKVSTCEFCKKDFKAAKVPYRHREACKRRCEQTNATSVMFRSKSSRSNDANDSIVSDSSTSNFMFEIISDSE